MIHSEIDRLVTEMVALPAYRGWCFTFEYPGYFCYSHPNHSYSVFFTPDWEGEETLPIEVQFEYGTYCEEHSGRLPLPREGRTAQAIFELVRPTLDKIEALPTEPLFDDPDMRSSNQAAQRSLAAQQLNMPVPTFVVDLHVRLTVDEIAALQKAHEHVRVHMAHEHGWNERDNAMSAISKVLAAAKSA